MHHTSPLYDQSVPAYLRFPSLHQHQHALHQYQHLPASVGAYSRSIPLFAPANLVQYQRLDRVLVGPYPSSVQITA
eukprot:2881133-Rhodomonas_salina.1